jgi:D-alanyl-D-alanine carboxypeptidase (penicillin-binding protein 5/6)
MRSINGATVALAEAVAGSEESFVHMMNEKMARVGAENTCFVNASGLPGPDQHTTALELSLIMRQALRYHLIREIISTKTTVVYTLEGRRLSLKNTNQLLWSGDEFLGGKTGYTRAARHCFVSAAKKGHATLITAILGESSRDNLWLETEMLLARGLNILQDGAGPVIEVSNVIPEKPVVLASYTRSRNAHSKSKAAYSGNSKAKKYKAVKTIAKDPKKKFLAASDKKRKIAEIAVKAREDARKDSRKHFSAENQSIKKS